MIAELSEGTGERLVLAPGQVHLWGGTLGALLQVPRGEAWLSAAERQRAARFRLERDRQRFVRRRSWLRRILSWYLDVAPADVRLDSTERGKPVLPDAAWLDFSVSHAGGRVLYAVAHGRRVGVDLERMRPDVDCEAIARSFFAAEEVRALLALPREARPAAFYRGWTRKEAYVKARGEGVSLPLDAFAVSLAEERWTSLVGDGREVERWAFLSLRPAPRYVASLAVELRPAAA